MSDEASPPGADESSLQRLFFAMFLPAAAADSLHRQAEPLAAHHGARLMRADSLHLTLAFLGARPGEEMPRLHEAAAEVSLGCSGIDVCFDRFGYWSHNKIVWAGCSQGPQMLGELAAQLTGALRKRGYTLERRPFVPHVTLLRRCPGPPAPDHAPDVACTLGEFQLVVSQTAAGGARYRAVARWPLR
jgi:RNA 2',3'-cyclic 3'-phosphodiesterase